MLDKVHGATRPFLSVSPWRVSVPCPHTRTVSCSPPKIKITPQSYRVHRRRSPSSLRREELLLLLFIYVWRRAGVIRLRQVVIPQAQIWDKSGTTLALHSCMIQSYVMIIHVSFTWRAGYQMYGSLDTPQQGGQHLRQECLVHNYWVDI